MRDEETGRVELPGLVARPFSKRVCKTGMHVVSVEESGGIEPLGLPATTLVFKTSSPPLRGALHLAGGRRIERRWPDLESSLIPDRCPYAVDREGIEPSASCLQGISAPQCAARFPLRGLSGWQDSNLHHRGPKPRGQPLTHTQVIPSARLERACQRFKGADPALDHEGQCRWVTGGDRTLTVAFTARRAEPLHHGHHLFPDLDLNQGLRVQIVLGTLKGFRTSRDELEAARPPSLTRL